MLSFTGKIYAPRKYRSIIIHELRKIQKLYNVDLSQLKCIELLNSELFLGQYMTQEKKILVGISYIQHIDHLKYVLHHELGHYIDATTGYFGFSGVHGYISNTEPYIQNLVNEFGEHRDFLSQKYGLYINNSALERLYEPVCHNPENFADAIAFGVKKHICASRKEKEFIAKFRHAIRNKPDVLSNLFALAQ